MFCHYRQLNSPEHRDTLSTRFVRVYRPASSCQIIQANLQYRDNRWELKFPAGLRIDPSKTYVCVHIVYAVHNDPSSNAWGHITALVLDSKRKIMYSYDPQKHSSAFPLPGLQKGITAYHLLRELVGKTQLPIDLSGYSWSEPQAEGMGLQEWLEDNGEGNRTPVPEGAGPVWWCKDTRCPLCPDGSRQRDHGGMCVTLVILLTVVCDTLGVWDMTQVSNAVLRVFETFLSEQKQKGDRYQGNPARAILRRRVFMWVLNGYSQNNWQRLRAC